MRSTPVDQTMKADDVVTRSIAWDPVSDEPPSENRIIAQTMNFGTFHDVVILEQTVGKNRLVEVMLRARTGLA